MRKHYFLSSLVIFVAGFALSAIIDGRGLASLARGTLFNSVAPEVSAQITRQSSTIQKWEYRVVRPFNNVRNNNQGGGMDFELNRLGEQGFEVCGVAQNGNDLGNLIMVLKRPK